MGKYFMIYAENGIIKYKRFNELGQLTDFADSMLFNPAIKFEIELAGSIQNEYSYELVPKEEKQ